MHLGMFKYQNYCCLKRRRMLVSAICELFRCKHGQPNRKKKRIQKILWHVWFCFQVYNSVLSWVHYDRQKRSQYFSQIMEHVRLALVSEEFLFTVSICSSVATALQSWIVVKDFFEHWHLTHEAPSVWDSLRATHNFDYQYSRFLLRFHI